MRTIGCPAHPFASTWGATCILPANHAGTHLYQSAWLADAHDRAEAVL